MSGLTKRLTFWKQRTRRRAAKQEVLALIHENPVAGYGLYHVLDDAGLLAPDARRELAPLLERIAARIHAGHDDGAVTLPLRFDPITDVEHDTLTSLVGQAVRSFVGKLAALSVEDRLFALLGLNDLLARHVDQTACIAYEVALEPVLLPLLQHCGAVLPYYRPDGLCNAQPGDYFRITNLRRSKQKLPAAFLKERAAAPGEIVRVDAVWDRGYLRAERLVQASAYSKAWYFPRVLQTLPNAAHLTVVHQEEGELYRLAPRYAEAVARFVTLYRQHLSDRSADPAVYQPGAPSPVDPG